MQLARLVLAGLALSPACAVPADIGESAGALTDPVPTGPGVYTLAFDTSDGDQRAYVLYLPDDYDQTRVEPFPLVAMFHGLGGSASGFAGMLATTGLQTLADDQDKIIVFLHGRVGTSVTTSGWWDYSPNGRDDVLYTQELLDHLHTELNVDCRRVFAAGHSLGGRFVHELGSRDPWRFRAIADVSGFYALTGGAGPAAPPPGALLPVLIVHSFGDGVVPLAGGVGTLLPMTSFEPTLFGYNAWYANNGCTEPTQRLLSIGWDIQQTDCDAPRADPLLQFVTVTGGTHAWPDVPGDWYDASSEILAFFDAQ